MRKLVKLSGHFLGFLLYFYFAISVLIFTPYYNWKYAKEHGFADWIFFGEVIATSKAMVWPYFIFFKKEKQISKTRPPDVLTPQFLDKYASQLNKQVPMKGPDDLTMVRVSSSDDTIIYDLVASDPISSETTNYLSTLDSTKHTLCNQEAESFFLSRGIGLSWNYFDSQKKYVGTISVTPQDCEKSY